MTNRRSCFRRTLTCVLLGTAQLSFGAAALAQDQDTAAASDETIVITGSRIRRNPLDQAAPIAVLDQRALEQTGLSSVADILQRLPSSGGGLNSKFNNSGNFGNPPDGGGVGAGSAEVDLRYLGSRRTLVLVDGVRFVNGASASGIPASTDLNSIPQGMIDRIEVLQDGASPIYGSDAIAGVVNIITRDGQDGLRLSAQYGQYLSEGDGETLDLNGSWGIKSERTSFVIGASYVDQKRVNSSDRSISLFPNPGSTSCLGGGCSSGTPLGRFIVNNPLNGDGLDLTLKAAVPGAPAFDPLDPTGPNSDFKDFTTADRFNFAPFNLILTPSERLGGFVSFRQELTDSINLRVRAVYNHRKSANQAAPLPLFVGPDAGNGNLLDRISIDATNPFNPFGVTLESGKNLDGTSNGNATNYAFIGRRFVENGPRRYFQTVDTMYATATLDGEFELAGHNWYWDASATIGHNDAKQKFLGNVNAINLAQALGPIADCTGACVPFNIFGGEGSITQAQMDFVTFVERARSTQRLGDATFNVSGDLFELPGGPVGVAIGYEHRDQKGSFDPDPVVAMGAGSDIPAQPSGGRFNVDEIYGEVRAPILKDRPFFELLEASFAARHSNYSTFGGSTTLKAGLQWKPTKDILFRGSWAEGFRAPGIGELFGTPSRFDQELADPCSDMLGLSGGTPASATVQANCIAAGVPATGAYVQNNPQLSVVTGGNSALDPETSESWVFGAVFSPEWLDRRLSVEVNYYDISLDNAIQPIGAEVLLGRCTEANDAFSCAAISRTASGAIAQISGLLQNIGAIDTKGLDVTLTYRTPETSFGTIGLYWTNTFLLDYTETVPATNGSTAIDREGTERGSPDQTFPKWKSTGTIDWSINSFSASFTGRYIKGVTESQNGNKLGSRFYGDVQATWTPAFLDDRFGLTLGVNNVFDSDPPACISCGLNNFDPTTYDVPGQFGYVRLSYKM